MHSEGLSERHALRVVRMSASALRYAPVPDRNELLHERILELAHRYRRYGAGMIYLKLRQKHWVVNHKRVDRLYALAKLQLRRRKRKKVPAADRQPLMRPEAANQVWSMDFVFDRTAEGRVIKCLTIVDDAAHGSRLAPCDTNRQWQRVLWSRHADLGTRAGRHAATYRAGQAQSERLHRKLQRPPAR